MTAKFWQQLYQQIHSLSYQNAPCVSCPMCVLCLWNTDTLSSQNTTTQCIVSHTIKLSTTPAACDVQIVEICFRRYLDAYQCLKYTTTSQSFRYKMTNSYLKWISITNKVHKSQKFTNQHATSETVKSFQWVQVIYSTAHSVQLTKTTSGSEVTRQRLHPGHLWSSQQSFPVHTER